MAGFLLKKGENKPCNIYPFSLKCVQIFPLGIASRGFAERMA